MIGVDTTLRDVQAVLLSLFTDKTILVGHSLESDLVALKVSSHTINPPSAKYQYIMAPLNQ